MNGSESEILFNNKSISSYFSASRGSAAPGMGIVVVSAIFGVTDEMKKIADDLALEGYPTVVPDMFWRIDPGPLPSDPAGYQQGIARVKDYDRDEGLQYVVAATDFLKLQPSCNGRIAIMGFCFGGAFALLGATRLGIDASISFHGTDVGRHLDEVPKATCPLSFHYGDNDEVAPMSEVNRIIDACGELDNAEIFIYPGAQHAYMFPSRGDIYDPGAAKLSWQRALEFLDRVRS